jgi:hypothetical protein
MIDIGKTLRFNFLQFFGVSSFQKVLILPQFFWRKFNMGIKNAEFYAEFKFVDKGLKKI